MFEETIIVHRQQLDNLLNKNKRFTYLGDIMSNPHLDLSFKTYFNAEVEWWIYEESIRRKIHVNFDFEKEDLKNNFSNIDELLYNSARFDKNSLKITIDSAITTLLNYFVRPRTAIKWFVYRGEPTKPFNEIIKRLNYFNEYQYLISGFIHYVEENHIQRNPDDLFSVIEFSRIIEKIDNDYLFNLLPEDFINLLLPILKFFNPAIPDINSMTPIPSEALIIFLDDKGIDPLKQSVEKQLIQNRLKYINGDQFLKIIYDLINQLDSEGILTPTVETITEQDEITQEYNLYDLENALENNDILTEISNEKPENLSEESDINLSLGSFDTKNEINDSLSKEAEIEISDEDNSHTFISIESIDRLNEEFEKNPEINNIELIDDLPTQEIESYPTNNFEESSFSSDVNNLEDKVNVSENIGQPFEEEIISDETILEQELQMLSDFRELSELSEQINSTFSKVQDLREIHEPESALSEMISEDMPEELSANKINEAHEQSDSEVSDKKKKDFDHYNDGEEIIKFE